MTAIDNTESVTSPPPLTGLARTELPRTYPSHRDRFSPLGTALACIERKLQAQANLDGYFDPCHGLIRAYWSDPFSCVEDTRTAEKPNRHSGYRLRLAEMRLAGYTQSFWPIMPNPSVNVESSTTHPSRSDGVADADQRSIDAVAWIQAFPTDQFRVIASELPPVVQEFAHGINGVAPAPIVVEMAARVVRAAVKHTRGPHITVDDEDGDLDFHLRLADNLLVMANLFRDGTIDASVYDDSEGIPVKTVKRMRRSMTSADALISLFEQGNGCAGTE